MKKLISELEELIKRQEVKEWVNSDFKKISDNWIIKWKEDSLDCLQKIDKHKNTNYTDKFYNLCKKLQDAHRAYPTLSSACEEGCIVADSRKCLEKILAELKTQ